MLNWRRVHDTLLMNAQENLDGMDSFLKQRKHCLHITGKGRKRAQPMQGFGALG